MPHVNSGGSEDFFSNDEVKVYKDEGEEEQRSSENLSEDKLGLVTETEEGKSNGIGSNFPGNEKSDGPRSDDGKSGQPQDRSTGQFGYVPPYPHYPNGSSPLGSKFQPPMTGLMMYNNEPFAQPPPAHMGIPPVHIDPKTGLPRPSMYAYPPPGQFPPSLYSPDLSQVQWRGPHYPISSGAFSGAAYPPSLVNSSPLSRFGPPGLFPPPGLHPGMPHPGLMSPGSKQEGGISAHSQDRNMLDQGSNSNSGNPPEDKKKNHIKKPLNAFMLFMKEVRAQVVAECTLKESAAINQILGRRVSKCSFYDSESKRVPVFFCRDDLEHGSSSRHSGNLPEEKKKNYVKKPLNAFMLFMKEVRAKVVAECTLKESAAINQILGRRWHALDRAEQAKYYEMARKEKELHMQLYPGWSARDNYASHTKKKRKKKDGTPSKDCSNPKKCRARYGLEQQNQWCKPCRSLHEQSCETADIKPSNSTEEKEKMY